MAIREIPYKDKAEWLEIRRGYIGGSDAASVVGRNPYRSALTLWAEKTGQIEAFAGNLTTEVGTYLEAFVAQKWAEQTGKQVRRKNRIIVNDRYPFACADVDRMVVGEKAALECKTTNSIPILRALRTGGDEFPDAYYAQCVHYMAVAELERMYLAVLCEGRELLIYTLERDQAEIDALMDAEGAFWQMVQQRIPPAVDGQADTDKTLAALYPAGTDEDRVDLSALDAELRAYLALGERIKALKENQGEFANRIKMALGNHTRGECAAAKVSWTASTKNNFDKARFVSQMPGVDISAFFNTSISRTLRVTAK